MLCCCLLWTVAFAIAHKAICKVTAAYGQTHSAECSALTPGCEAISTMESSQSQHQQDQIPAAATTRPAHLTSAQQTTWSRTCIGVLQTCMEGLF